MGAFFSTFDWQHASLLAGSILGGVLVGVGILKELEKWSVATISVMIGVIIEPIFTIGLFLYDEAIRRAQSDEIIGLRKAAAPRNIRGDDFRKIADAICDFPDVKYDLSIPPMVNGPYSLDLLEPGSYLVDQLITSLKLGGWKLQSIQSDVSKAALP